MHECVRDRRGWEKVSEDLASDYETLRAAAAKVALEAIRASGAPPPKNMPVMPAPLTVEGEVDEGGAELVSGRSGKKRLRRSRGADENDGACHPPVIAGRSLTPREEEQAAAVGMRRRGVVSRRRKIEGDHQSGPPAKRRLT